MSSWRFYAMAASRKPPSASPSIWTVEVALALATWRLNPLPLACLFPAISLSLPGRRIIYCLYQNQDRLLDRLMQPKLIFFLGLFIA